MSKLLEALHKTEADLLTPTDSPDGHGLRLGIFAEEGAGKTHLMMSRPGPLVLFNFEHNVDRVLARFPGKEVVVHSYPAVMDGTMSSAKPIADKFRTDYFKTLKDLEKAGLGPADVSLGIDSISAVWDLFQLAYIARDNDGKAAPKDYEKANAMYRSILVEAAYHQQVLICTSRAPFAWGMVDNGKGGQVLAELSSRKAAWNKHTPHDLDVVIELQRRDKVDKGKVVNYRSYLVKKCTSNDKLYGKRLEELFGGGNAVDYEYLMNAISMYQGDE